MAKEAAKEQPGVREPTDDPNAVQSRQAHKMDEREREKVGQKAADARKTSDEDFQKRRIEEQQSMRTSKELYAGDQRVERVRDLRRDDKDWSDTEARSVYRTVDGTERVYRDSDITGHPNPIAPRVFGVGSEPPRRPGFNRGGPPSPA